MIFALAGLGDTYKLASFSQQPGVNMSMVNAMSPSSQEATQEAGFPWALAGLVALGVGIAYASYISDPHRDGSYEPNRSRHARRRVAPWAKGRVNVIIAERGMGGSKGDEKKAYGALKSVGAKNVKIDRPKGRSRSKWIVGGWIKKSEIRALRSKLKPRMLRMMRVQ